MGRPRKVSMTSPTSGLGIEYVKSRRVVRLLGHCRGEALDPVEIPVDRLCEELAIEPRDLGSPETYLLFAGEQRTAGGGLRDLVGTFPTEDEGRQAFARLRVLHPAARGWAELAAIDGFGRIRQICWFGLGGDQPVPSGPHVRTDEPVPITSRRKSLRRLIAG